MLYKLKDAKKVERQGFTAFKYNSKADLPEMNAIFVDCHDSHEKCSVKNSFRLYFVIDGTGEFLVGEEKFSVEKNDVVIIPPKTAYAYKGKMKLFEANAPATSSEDEIKL
ncbi:MAG: hypothetical protein AABX51_01900 [Nanoarchaeota archaeon]